MIYRHPKVTVASLLCFSSLLTNAAGAAEASDLWGQSGEKWTPASRLPDVSFAGYECGEKDIPSPTVSANVRDFGAKGDGVADDTQALNDAIAATTSGAILVPAGTYKITNFVTIDKPNLVLRGEGDKTILWFPLTLTDVKPNWGSTTTGKRTSNYSWDGGYLVLSGSMRGQSLATITAVAKRGDSWISVSTVSGISVGRWVQVSISDDAPKSLTDYIYDGESGSTSSAGTVRTFQAARVKTVDEGGKRVELDRPLRFETRAAWSPSLNTFDPTVTNSGFESMALKFPTTPWQGEFSELGYNGVLLTGVAHCWVRNITLINAEGGIFLQNNSTFNTVSDITLTATKAPYTGSKYNTDNGCVGHHGIMLTTPDNLVTRFDFKMSYVHDLSVQEPQSAGNVFSNGRADDMCFDHHKHAPFSNVFTNVDCGAGNRIYRSGGGANLGLNSGGWETFWNIRAAKSLVYPPATFGPASMNLVGFTTSTPSTKILDGKWFEAVKPSELTPQSIHEAQLTKRLGTVRPGRGSGSGGSPSGGSGGLGGGAPTSAGSESGGAAGRLSSASGSSTGGNASVAGAPEAMDSAGSSSTPATAAPDDDSDGGSSCSYPVGKSGNRSAPAALVLLLGLARFARRKR